MTDWDPRTVLLAAKLVKVGADRGEPLRTADWWLRLFENAGLDVTVRGEHRG